MNRINLTLEQVTKHLRSGDLVFYRASKFSPKGFRTWLSEKIVAWWQHSPYIHVGMLDMKNGVPWILDMSSTDNGREDPLEYDLVDYEVDIYRVNRPTNKRIKFTEFGQEDGCIESTTYRFEADYILVKMREYCQKKYSWKANLRIFLERRFGFDILTNDEATIRAINCATAVEAAYNDAGFDLCPRVSPNFATPDRLAKSALLDYLFTIKND